jgi:hypothetical protein
MQFVSAYFAEDEILRRVIAPWPRRRRWVPDLAQSVCSSGLVDLRRCIVEAGRQAGHRQSRRLRRGRRNGRPAARRDIREDENVVITEPGGLRAQTHVFDRFRRSWVAGELGSPPIGTTLPTRVSRTSKGESVSARRRVFDDRSCRRVGSSSVALRKQVERVSDGILSCSSCSPGNIKW